VDGYDVCKYLKVSSRTLQRLRSKGLLNYSVSSGKAMYKMGEVRRMLEQNLIKSNPQNFQALLNNYKKHAE
jgi:predicted site-specific integrase-resolvase